MTTTTLGRHARPPSLATFLIWVVACLDAWIMGATGGRHEGPTKPVEPVEREEFGADLQWADTMHGWIHEDEDDTDHLYDVLDSAMLLAPMDASYREHVGSIKTAPFTPSDYADAMPRLWDATEVALRAGRIGGA